MGSSFFTNASKRRSARTLLDILFNSLVKWLAPFLVFTCEEAWKARGNSKSIHLEEFESISEKLRANEVFSASDTNIDPQILKKISKFASIKHILKKTDNNEYKVIELLEEIIRDIKNHELEIRISELESKFSKDLNESTFNEIRELKKLQKFN